MNQRLLYCLFCFCLLSCSQRNNKQSDAQKTVRTNIDESYTVLYAKGFQVNLFDSCKQVIVKNPWDTTKVLHKYVLVDKNIELPANLPEGTLIRTPLSKVLVHSAVHSSIINEIGMVETIKGVCEPQYIDVPYIKKGVEDKTVKNLGRSSNPDRELIVEIEPEAFFIESMEGKRSGSLENLGIPLIETPDYMETSPLANAEWIRFYALFYDNVDYVDSLFDETVKNYNYIKEKTEHVTQKPTVFFDLMYSGGWYVSGGKSFLAKIVSDAGAAYVWNEDRSITGKQFSFEQVFDKASEADFWLIRYNAAGTINYQDIMNEYKPYSYFRAFQNKNIYLCNTAKNKYFQDLAIHPDFVLKDLAHVFHPDLFPGYTPKYFIGLK